MTVRRTVTNWLFWSGLAVLVVCCWPCSIACSAPVWVDSSWQGTNSDGTAERPFRQLAHALAAAKEGDVIVLRGGIYREQLRLVSLRGVTVRAAAGERVVLTGATPVRSWQQVGNQIWATPVSDRPLFLLVNERLKPPARLPREGWWRVSAVEDECLFDNVHLKAGPLANFSGLVYIWLRRGNVFGRYPVRTLDTDLGKLCFDAGSRKPTLTEQDRYWLEHDPRFLEEEDDWAAIKAEDGFTLYYRCHDQQNLQGVEVPTLKGALVTVRNCENVTLERLEIRGSNSNGIEVWQSSHVTIRNCLVHDNIGLGVLVRGCRNCSIENSIICHNEHGVAFHSAENCKVICNDIGYNRVDGLLVTWGSKNVAAERNYIHHHLLWGHPDNVQVYRHVTGLVLRENLILAGGQAIMMEETSQGAIEGNMIVGSAAYMLIMGHGNAGNYTIRNNTFACAGYGCMSLTWRDYTVADNVFFSGHAGALYGVRGITGYRADRNLFWNTIRAEKPQIMATNAGWLRDFDKVKASTGQDTNSVYADPCFRNAPLAFAVVNSGQIERCTRDRLYIRHPIGLFRQGDYVEVNFDGIARQVVDIEQDAIVISPPLDRKPVKGWLVGIWGENSNTQLDLRLRPESPGARLSESSGPVGSQLCIARYQSGDFDGDGKRDIPAVPASLKEERLAY